LARKRCDGGDSKNHLKREIRHRPKLTLRIKCEIDGNCINGGEDVYALPKTNS
jgi:hypothetical protein